MVPRFRGRASRNVGARRTSGLFGSGCEEHVREGSEEARSHGAARISALE